MSIILHIAVPTPLPKVFDYLNNDQQQIIQPGMRVLVPFGLGSRNVVGMVVAISETEMKQHKQKLKTIVQCLDQQPLLLTELLKLINWVSDYYHYPIGECFTTALPSKLNQGEAAELKSVVSWELINKQYQLTTALGKKQQQIVDYLQQQTEAVSQAQLNQQFGLCKPSLQGLERKGMVQPLTTVQFPLSKISKPLSVKLLAAQQHIVDSVLAAPDQFCPYLLYGVTGSGKTQVYIELVKQIVNQGKQALVLIPEIGLTSQLVTRFQQQLPVNMVILNSAVSDADRKQAWLLAKAGLAEVIIGTRSAVFTPLPKPGIIIVDEEHDNSYKQQQGLPYHARNIALIRAKQWQIPIVLASATPSLETLYNVEQQRHTLLQLTERATGANLPTIKLIDNLGPSAGSGISSVLYHAITKQISLDNQVLLFINRRGFAPVLMCHGCGWQASCRSCDARMVVHQQRGLLICHHCGFTQPLIKQCPDCDSTELATYGVGTQQLEQTLQHYFPDTPIIRIDRDSTQKATAFTELINTIDQGGSKILIGTQMLAKGHDFHNVTLVGVLDADYGLYSVDFRATENLAQLITQVTGRAGRGVKSGQVLLQTSQVNHQFWQDLLQHDYLYLAQKLLAQRKKMAMPPFAYLSVIRSQAKHKTLAMQFLTEVVTVLNQDKQHQVVILGPVAALMEKRADRYRAQLLLSSQNRQALHQLLDRCINTISTLKSSKKVRWSIDIDPLDLM